MSLGTLIHFPLWALFALLAATFSAAQMLLTEKFNAAPLPTAFWVKVSCAIVMTPFVIRTGLPHNPLYYEMLIAQSFLWVVSDVIFCRGINDVGAGVIARVLPIGAIISFFLWFFVDWPLVSLYLKTPLHSLMIIAILALLCVFAWNLRECHITRKALRLIWFVLFANVVGAITTKLITEQADIAQGIFPYVFCEAIIMITMWLIYYACKKPVPTEIMFGTSTIKAGLTIGFAAAACVASTVYAVYHIDNPGYVSAIKYLNAVMIFFYNRATGCTNQGHVWAGLGIVSCTAALVIVKSAMTAH